MNLGKRLLSLFLSFALLLGLASAVLPQRAAAAFCEGDRLESVKDGVPLRDFYGEDYEIKGRLSKEGTVVVITSVKEYRPHWYTISPHIWYKVKVTAGVSGCNAGEYWIWEGNLRDHDHSLSSGRCTSPGCDYERKRKVIDNISRVLIVAKPTVPVREAPYAESVVARIAAKDQLVSTVGVIEARSGSYWYVTADGKYIYTDNLREPTKAEYTAANNKAFDAAASGTGSTGGSGVSYGGAFLEPEIDYSAVEKLPCVIHKWSKGECTVCGAKWNLNIYQALGTYTTKEDGAVARDIPYKEGKVMHTYPTKGTKVEVTGYAWNAHHNVWYRTKEGWWIYNVVDSSLQSVAFAADTVSFSALGETVRTKLKPYPSTAVIDSITYASSNPKVATVDANGVVTAVGAGKATITATVKAAEGTVKTCTCEVKLSKLDSLDKWTWSNNETFNYGLALECSEYMCLAYPSCNYYTSGGKTLIYDTDRKSRTPDNLVKLMRSRGWNCQVADTYTDRTRWSSPYTLAVKEYNYNGVITPVVFVVIMGTGGYPGWEGNMMMTGEEYEAGCTEHATFLSAAKKIQNALKDYASGFAVKPLVVITGHSRGAAVGNLLARRVDEAGIAQKVYAYTFATPNCTTSPKNCKFIFNICNTDDFVTYLPLKDKWGFKKNGTTCNFSSSYHYTMSSSFAGYINEMLAKSKKNGGSSHATPDYNYQVMKPFQLAAYLAGKFPSVAEYYLKNNAHAWTCDGSEAYDYMYKGLAKSAEGDLDGYLVLIKHVACAAKADYASNRMLICAFTPVSDFFVNNGIAKLGGLGLGAFADSHIAMTYHAAMLAKCYNSQGTTLYSEPEDPAPAPLEEEAAALRSFFTGTEENRLALAEAGWDAEDPATWTGVTWDGEGHIVSLDLSYMDFSGWLNLSPLTGLREALLDGNRISTLGVTGCRELANLSCMCNEITVMDVAQCTELRQLNCAFNQLSSLSVSGLSHLEELNCCYNAIENLDLSGASALTYLECSANHLTGLDVSTNTALNALFCSGNQLCSEDSPELVSALSAMGRSLGRQQYDPSFAYDETELALLTEFADMSDNREKLGWDPEDPWSWNGVEWDLFFDEMGAGTYHVRSLSLDGLELQGTLSLPSMEHLESLSCTGSKLSGLYLNGCTALTTVDCTESGIASLDVSECEALDSLALSGNYLDPGISGSELSQLGLQTGLITWENQHVPGQEDAFDANERTALLRLLYTGVNASILGWTEEKPGDWFGVVWVPDESGIYRVNKLNFGLLPLTGVLDLTGFDYLEDFDFSGSQLESVILPDSVAAIPDYAFADSSLESVTLPEGVASIGENAFAGCTALRTLLLPATLQSVGDGAFRGCSALTDAVFLGDEPLRIGENAFADSAAGFRVLVREEKDWTAALPEDLPAPEAIPAGKEVLLLADRSLTLRPDGAFDEENPYTGYDAALQVISLTADRRDVLCLLALYGETGQAISTTLQEVSLAPGLNTVLFRSVDLLNAGEFGCTMRCFLLDKETQMPLTENTMQMLVK